MRGKPKVKTEEIVVAPVQQSLQKTSRGRTNFPLKRDEAQRSSRDAPAVHSWGGIRSEWKGLILLEVGHSLCRPAARPAGSGLGRSQEELRGATRVKPAANLRDFGTDVGITARGHRYSPGGQEYLSFLFPQRDDPRETEMSHSHDMERRTAREEGKQRLLPKRLKDCN